MPRFCRALPGPRVTVRPQVISATGIARPARLHRQPRKIDIGALPHDFLARRRAALLGHHVHHLQEDGPRVLPRVLQPLGRLGLLQEREQLADFAQSRDRFLAHPPRHALCRPEQVSQHRNRVALGFSNSKAGPACRNTRSQISVISSRGSTSARMRFSSPRLSSCARKSRRSAYFMGNSHVTKPRCQGRVVRMRHDRHRRRVALSRRPPRHLRHRAGELRPLVLPSHGTGGDRQRVDARVRDKQRAAGHARGDVLLRLHGAADSSRRARRHVGATTDSRRRIAACGCRFTRFRSRADVGNRRGRPHAGRCRRIGRVHRDPQGECRMVSGQPVRDAERCHHVCRQPRGRDRRRSACLDGDADIVAHGVRRPCGLVDGARDRNLVEGSRSPRGCGIRARECTR